GQLTEKDGPWGFPYRIFKWVMLARSAGVRCIFLNVGAGPLTHPIGKFFVRRALQASYYVSLRDGKSLALLRKIDFRGEGQVCPDCVYGLDVVAATNKSAMGRRAETIIGFAPMPFPGERDNLKKNDQIIYDELLRKLAMFGS